MRRTVSIRRSCATCRRCAGHRGPISGCWERSSWEITGGGRSPSRALQYGGYRELSVDHELLAFTRQVDDEYVVVVVNGSNQLVALDVEVPVGHGDRLVDLLNPGQSFALREGRAEIDAVWPHWARILAVC